MAEQDGEDVLAFLSTGLGESSAKQHGSSRGGDACLASSLAPSRTLKLHLAVSAAGKKQNKKKSNWLNGVSDHLPRFFFIRSLKGLLL